MSRLEHVGKFADDVSMIRAALDKAGSPSGSINQLLGGRSGDRVWDVASGSDRLVIKITPVERLGSFVSEIASLLALERTRLTTMGTAKLMGAWKGEIAGESVTVSVQSWCLGRGLGHYVNSLMLCDPHTGYRIALLERAVMAFKAVGTAFREFHFSSGSGKILDAESRFTRMLQSDFRAALVHLRSVDGHDGFEWSKCRTYLQRLLQQIPDRRLPLGLMHLDPHFGNVRVDEQDGRFWVSVIDTKTAYYSLCQQGPAFGLPGFDCHLLTTVYLHLRAVRGPLTGQGSLSQAERDALGSAFWEGYGDTASDHLSGEAREFYDAMQCCWYLTWFPFVKYATLGDCDDLDGAARQKQIAVHFYLKRLTEFIQGRTPELIV